MTDYAQTYGALRSRVSDLVRGVSGEELERLTPAAPEWRVRDVVAHLSGITADINAGNLDGVATDSWTARQVDARRDWTIDQILGEWDTEAAKVEPLMSTLPDVAMGQMTTDAATHEQDIRGALERPGAPRMSCSCVAASVVIWPIATSGRVDMSGSTFAASVSHSPRIWSMVQSRRAST